MLRKKLLIISICLFSSHKFWAQCAMCKAVVETGNENMAEGVNNGITYLMIFPYLLIGVLAYFLYKHKNKNSKL